MATRSLGTTIKQGTTVIGSLTEINGVEKTSETIDVTVLDSTDGYREFVTSFKDGGEVSLTGFFDESDTGQALLETNFEAGTSASYTITFPASTGTTWTFDGVVTKIMTSAQVGEVIPFEATIKISGKPTLTIT